MVTGHIDAFSITSIKIIHCIIGIKTHHSIYFVENIQRVKRKRKRSKNFSKDQLNTAHRNYMRKVSSLKLKDCLKHSKCDHLYEISCVYLQIWVAGCCL